METVVSLFIISVLIIGIASLIELSLKITQNNRYYAVAIEIANEKLENIRNLSYEKIGTTHGSPYGVLPEFETINREGAFLVHTTAMFYDDPFDGTLVGGNDEVFIDYKIVTVDVSWQKGPGRKHVVLFSKIIPNTEETLSGYGLLKISVVDANGSPISGADVHVVNDTLSPTMDAYYSTDAQGFLTLPVLPALDSYQVFATKDGYSTEQTYPRTLENPNPTKPNYSVLEGQKTEDSLAIDHLATVQVQVLNASSLPENWLVNGTSENLSRSSARVAVTGDNNNFIVWQDQADSLSSINILGQLLDSTGAKLWALSKTIDIGTNPDAAATETGKLFAVWQKAVAGVNDVYLGGFDSTGSSLFANKLVNAGGSGSEKANPRLVVSENSGQATTTIVWQDERSGNWDIYAQSFDQSGNRLWPNDLALAVGSNDETTPVITRLADDTFLAVWSSYNPSTLKHDLYAQKFNLAGQILWPQPQALVKDQGDEITPSLSASANGNFYLAFTDNSGSASQVYWSSFTTDAVPIIGNKAVGQSASLVPEYAPSIVASDAYIYISWTDSRDGNNDAYLQKFNPAGNAVWLRDWRLNSTIYTSSQAYSSLVERADETCVAVWQDVNGNINSIYVAAMKNFPIEVAVSGASVELISSKKIGENPIIYKYDKTFTANSSGLINLSLEWDSTGYSVRSTTGSLMSSAPEQFVPVLPAEDKIIRIYVK